MDLHKERKKKKKKDREGKKFFTFFCSYARAVALEPDLPEAWTGQALLNELQGEKLRLEEARVLYASVAAVRADLNEANLGLGRAALASNEVHAAEMGLLRALDRDPTNTDAQYMLALAFERQGRLVRKIVL